jgi:hypothetical protein
MKIEITVKDTGPHIDVDDDFIDASELVQQNLIADAISMLHGLALELESE